LKRRALAQASATSVWAPSRPVWPPAAEQVAAVGRVGMGQDAQARVAPLDAHQLAVLRSSSAGIDGQELGVGLLACSACRLCRLRVSPRGCRPGVGGVALQAALHLAGLVAAGQTP
jgi:hypothetical protein